MSEIPFYPDPDPVIAAVTKEVKEAYGQGHEAGYRMAIQDIEVWLLKLAQVHAGFPVQASVTREDVCAINSLAIRQLANEISTGAWRNTK